MLCREDTVFHHDYLTEHRNTLCGQTSTVSQLTRLYVIHQILFFDLLKPTGHVMHQQFNIQQLYVLHTLYLFFLYLSENKERLVPLTA